MVSKGVLTIWASKNENGAASKRYRILSIEELVLKITHNF